MPLHAGASTDVETTRYSAMQGFLPDLALAHSAFNPYLFFPGRQCHGQTVTHPALRRPPYIPADLKAERSPLSVCPADHCSLPAQAVSPVISPFPSAFIPGQGRPYSYNRCDFMLSPDAFLAVTGLVLPAANIGRRACPLRFEVHFLQILP